MSLQSAAKYSNSLVDVIGGQRLQTDGLSQNVQRAQQVVGQLAVMHVRIGRGQIMLSAAHTGLFVPPRAGR
jgi:hypothetical protein